VRALHGTIIRVKIAAQTTLHPGLKMPEKTGWKYALFRTSHCQQSPRARRVRACGREKPFERKRQIEGDSDMGTWAQRSYLYRANPSYEAGNMPKPTIKPSDMDSSREWGDFKDFKKYYKD